MPAAPPRAARSSSSRSSRPILRISDCTGIPVQLRAFARSQPARTKHAIGQRGTEHCDTQPHSQSAGEAPAKKSNMAQLPVR